MPSLGANPPNVDQLLSTLRRTVEAMGGSLALIATFPDRPLVAERDSRD